MQGLIVRSLKVIGHLSKTFEFFINNEQVTVNNKELAVQPVASL